MTSSRRVTGQPACSQLEVNLPLNFTGPQKNDHPLAPPIYLHYYQLIQGDLIPELGFRVPTPEPPDHEDKPEKSKIRHSRIGSRGSRKRFSSDESNGKRSRKRWSPDDEVAKPPLEVKSVGKAKKKSFHSDVKRKTPKLSITRNRSITLFPKLPPRERKGRVGSRIIIKPSKLEKNKNVDELRHVQKTIPDKFKGVEKGTENNTKGNTVIGEAKENVKPIEQLRVNNSSQLILTSVSPIVQNDKPKPMAEEPVPDVKLVTSISPIVQNDKPKPMMEELVPKVKLVNKLEPKLAQEVKPKPAEVKEEEQATHYPEKNNASELELKNEESSFIATVYQPKDSKNLAETKTSKNAEKTEPSDDSKMPTEEDGNSKKPEELDLSKLNDDEKMKLEREKLNARFNRRRARRKKKRLKEKSAEKLPKGAKKKEKAKEKKTNSKSKAEDKQKSGALGNLNSQQMLVKNQKGLTNNQVGTINNSTGAMNTPMESINMNNGQMNNQMAMMLQMMQANPTNPAQQGNYWEKMLMDLSQRLMMVEGGNRGGANMPSNNSGDRNHRQIADERKVPERGRSRSKSVEPTKEEPGKPRKKKGKRKYSRGRIKSLTGEMISTTIATSEEMVDKLELMVYFTGGKGQKKVKPLVLMVDKDWSFKKCMRKALAEMQKRPETKTNEDLMWINSYDVNTKEGIHDIRSDLRVLMGDHRTEHRGSGLNKKPSDYTNSFMNKIWIVPRKEVSLSSIMRRSKSVADLSTISEHKPMHLSGVHSTSKLKRHSSETFV